jgi:hypothetical protein
MQVLLSAIEPDQAEELESLSDWLRREPGLRGRVSWDSGRPDPTHLGDPSQALVVAVGSGGALTALAASLRAWFAQPRRPKVTIRIRGADGRVVEIDAQIDGEHVPELMAVLREGLREGRDAHDESI